MLERRFQIRRHQACHCGQDLTLSRASQCQSSGGQVFFELHPCKSCLSLTPFLSRSSATKKRPLPRFLDQRSQRPELVLLCCGWRLPYLICSRGLSSNRLLCENLVLSNNMQTVVRPSRSICPPTPDSNHSRLVCSLASTEMSRQLLTSDGEGYNT